MIKRVIVTSVILIVTQACVLLAFADSWSLPEPVKYLSSNKQYQLEVIPRKLESQLAFFNDKTKGVEPAGAAKGVQDNVCRGIFSRRKADGGYEMVWEVRLANDVSPVDALVSDKGEYVVTFDNWHSIGYGDDVVVIYGPGGKLIRKMSLADIFPKDSLVRLPRSVSSIYWGKNHYIDEEHQLLVLRVVSKWSGSSRDEAEYKDVKVDLKTGALVADKPVAE